MTFGTATNRRYVSAFTLVEVLAALLLMAIVIPVAIEALHTAAIAGEVAARKGEASRVANEVLNQSIVATNWNRGTQNGTVTDGGKTFRWTLNTGNWPQDNFMQLLTAQVQFSVQNKDYSVQMNTLVGSEDLSTLIGSQP